MANVNIKFNGKDFLLSCEDGQEEHLEELSEHLNKRFSELKLSLGNIGENKLLLISSISIMDEYFETKKKVDEKKKEKEDLKSKYKEIKKKKVDEKKKEIEDLKSKFKELKKLVYEYKDQKDEQITNLQNLQTNLKEEIDKSYLDYENTIDRATSKIENFLKNASEDSSVQ